MLNFIVKLTGTASFEASEAITRASHDKAQATSMVRDAFARIGRGLSLGPRLVRKRRSWARRTMRRAMIAWHRRRRRQARKMNQMCNRPVHEPRPLTYRALEPRMVFDAAAAATADGTASGATGTARRSRANHRAEQGADRSARPVGRRGRGPDYRY